MVKLSHKLNLNYYVLSPTYACSCQIWFQSGFEFQILPLSKIRYRKVQSIFSHFVWKDTLHLSKTVSGLFVWYDYSILDDKTKIFFAKYLIFYLIKWIRERAVKYHAPLGNIVTMAPPPLLSKIMPKHDEDEGDIGERNIGGQLGLVRIDSTQQPIKKHI